MRRVAFPKQDKPFITKLLRQMGKHLSKNQIWPNGIIFHQHFASKKLPFAFLPLFDQINLYLAGFFVFLKGGGGVQQVWRREKNYHLGLALFLKHKFVTHLLPSPSGGGLVGMNFAHEPFLQNSAISYPEIKNLNGLIIFPTRYAIPKCLKVSRWVNEFLMDFETVPAANKHLHEQQKSKFWLVKLT